jgi:DNA polymerase
MSETCSAERLWTVESAVDDVRRAALGCVSCKLHEMRTQVVFGHGNPRSPLVLVGQSPGEQEDKSGEPFVGPAGQLLTECLAEVGIQRSRIWITNVVKCRPYDVTGAARGRNRDPEEDEVEACRGWIEAELALIRPRVIVCIGSPSAGVVLGRKLVMNKDRGRWFTEHRFRPAYVMAVLHPAYLLRKHGAEFEELKRQFIGDLEEARRTTARLLKEPPAPPPRAAASREVPEPSAVGAEREPATVQPSLFGEDEA